MEDLHCRFLGVTVGDEVAAGGDGSLAGGEGVAGGESNGSGGGVSFAYEARKYSWG